MYQVYTDLSSSSPLVLQIPCEARCLGTRLTHSKTTSKRDWNIRDHFLYIQKTDPLQEDVLSVFAGRKDMVLKKEHLAAWQAWHLCVPKKASPPKTKSMDKFDDGMGEMYKSQVIQSELLIP